MKSLILIFTTACVVFAQLQSEEIHLWENGAPGFEEFKNEPEKAKDWWIKNIHNPAITAYLADPSIATGTAIIVAPGGGHKELVFNPEGRDAAKFLSRIGVSAFVLKYRLAKEENPLYTLEEHVKQDVYRAMRLVRSKADQFNIDTNRIGIMGFSAGGEVVAMVAYDDGQRHPDAENPIDMASARPDFQILIYPGAAFIPDSIPPKPRQLFCLWLWMIHGVLILLWKSSGNIKKLDCQ